MKLSFLYLVFEAYNNGWNDMGRGRRRDNRRQQCTVKDAAMSGMTRRNRREEAVRAGERRLEGDELTKSKDIIIPLTC